MKHYPIYFALTCGQVGDTVYPLKRDLHAVAVVIIIIIIVIIIVFLGKVLVTTGIEPR